VRRPSCRHCRRDDQGISLIEVVLSITILLLVLVPVSYVLNSVLLDAGSAVSQTAALSVAEGAIENLNNSGPPSNADGTPQVGVNLNEGTKTEAAVTYSVSARFDWATIPASANLCTAGTIPQVVSLLVTVTWGSDNTVTDSAILNYPPASVPTNGFIAQQINGDPAGNPGTQDATGNTWGGAGGRVTGVPVTFTPQTGSPITIDADTNGCAFLQVPPTLLNGVNDAGTYTVTIGPDPTPVQYVAPGSTASTVISSGLTVTTNQVTTSSPAQFDEGAYVGLSYPNSTVTDDGVTCPNVSSFQCVAFGQAPNGTAADGSTGIVATASVLSGSTWTSAQLTGVSRIESSACGSLCIGVGYSVTSGTSTGAVVTTSATSPTSWTASTVPSTALTQVQCPLPNVCVAIGTTSPSTGVLLSGTISGSTVSWVNQTPATVTALSQITCPTSSVCMAVGTTATGPVIVSGAITATSQTWFLDTLPASTKTLTQIACGTTACLAIGTTASAATVVAGTVTGATQLFVADTVPAGTTSLTQITCQGTTACLAIGAASATPTIIAGTVSATTQTWVADAPPSATLTSYLSISCNGGTGTTACLVLDTNTSKGNGIIAGPVSATVSTWYSDTFSSSPSLLSGLYCSSGSAACVATGSRGGTGFGSNAVIYTGALTSATTTAAESWSLGTYSPTGNTPVWISGVGCYGGSTPTCVAAASSQTTAQFLTNTSLPAASAVWAPSTTSLTSGLITNALPIEVSNSEPPAISYTACAAGACGSTIGPLFPFVNGYSVGAGTCLAELSNASASATSVPGTTQSNAPVATIPLGLLPVKVVTAAGAPVSGATVSISVQDPTTANQPACDVPSTNYTSPATNSDGLVRLDVIYETYTLSVKIAGVTTLLGTVAVTPTATIYTPTSGSAQTLSLPSPVVVI
jgi:hypothetical protein